MKVVFEDQEKKKKRRIIIAVTAVLLALIAAVVIFFVFKDQIRATTMRILRIEGIVNLEEDGLEKTISENLRLKSGNALGTAEQSLVSIGLDETKIVTLDELSRAEFEQKGKKLDLNLTRGSLFFEVSKPLEDAESFNIHTTTMVVGIRGTSGHVFVKNGQEGLVITDGQVHVIGTNPTTGEVKEIDVHAGERILVYLYNDRTVDSIEFKLEKITEHELDEFVLKILRENPELLDKVVAQTKWDKDWILGVKKDEAVNPSEEGAQVTEPSEPTPTPTPTPEPEDTETEEKPQETSGRTEPAEGPTEDQLTRAKNAIQATDAATGILALKDGTLFDPAFYAASNPDVVRVYGTDPVSLLAHWLSYGRREGRPPIAIPTPTPTPTPTFDPNAGKSGGSDRYVAEEEEEEEEEEPTPTPTPTQNPWTGTRGSFNSTSVNYEVTVGGTVIGQFMDATYSHLAITQPGTNLRLPLKVYDDDGGGTDPEIRRLSSIAWNDSYADNFIVDDGNGHVVTIDHPGGVIELNDNGTVYSAADMTDLSNEISNRGL